MAMRIRGSAALAAIAALALLLELAALFVLGPRLVAQIQRSAPQEWVTAADVTGRALTHAVVNASSRAVDMAERMVRRRDPDIALVALLESRSSEATHCRIIRLRIDRSELPALRRVRSQLRLPLVIRAPGPLPTATSDKTS